MVKKVKSQIKAYFFFHSNPITIISFLPCFKLACDTNHIHEGAAM